jgi:hypothetical protein
MPIGTSAKHAEKAIRCEGDFRVKARQSWSPRARERVNTSLTGIREVVLSTPSFAIARYRFIKAGVRSFGLNPTALKIERLHHYTEVFVARWFRISTVKSVTWTNARAGKTKAPRERYTAKRSRSRES